MNRWTRPAYIVAAALTVALSAAACVQQKSSNPLAPTIAGPIAGVSISIPSPVSPVGGQQINDADQPIAIQFGNAETNSVRPYTLTLQLAADTAFAGLAYTQLGIQPSASGVNRVLLPGRLPPGRTYYYRVRAEDGANLSEWSNTVQFTVLQPIVIGVPTPLTPVGNARVTSTSIQLRVRNGISSGPHGPLGYYFQAARDAAFASLLVNDWVNEGNGETAFGMTSPAPDTQIFWRSRISDGRNEGTWSIVETFRTPVAVVTPNPPPGNNTPCVSSSPLEIVTCERNKYGFMSDGQMLEFMKATARSLNANGIGGGPFGILRKTSGHQCGGYSCDVVCADNGNNQRQWDVLGDIETQQRPKWDGPFTVPNIRVDLCTVQ